MDDCCDLDSEALDRRQRRTLTIILVINAVMFLATLIAAIAAKSSSLLSGTIDNLGDAFTYALSLYAVSKGARHKAAVSLVKGLLILCAGLAVCAHVVYKFRHPELPIAGVIGSMTLAGLFANAACLILLRKHREEDINMASVWECSRNDVIENLAVLAAAFGVWLTRSQWPDMAVAILLSAFLLRSATRMVGNSVSALKKAA
jgi:Co/Zn/Cd efflux system component